MVREYYYEALRADGTPAGAYRTLRDAMRAAGDGGILRQRLLEDGRLLHTWLVQGIRTKLVKCEDPLCLYEEEWE